MVFIVFQQVLTSKWWAKVVSEWPIGLKLLASDKVDSGGNVTYDSLVAVAAVDFQQGARTSQAKEEKRWKRGRKDVGQSGYIGPWNFSF